MSHAIDETYDVYTELHPIARKPHRCSACEEPIAVGATYTRCTVVWDGKATTCGVLRSVILGALVPCLAPLPENVGLRPAPTFVGPHGTVTLRAMADIEPGQLVSFGGAGALWAGGNVALPKPAPVEPRGFKVGDRIRLNARGLKRHPNANMEGAVVSKIYGTSVYWHDSTHATDADCLEHVPSAPVYSPPPPSWAVAEIERVGGTRCPTCRGPAVELITSIACLEPEWNCIPWSDPEPTLTPSQVGRGEMGWRAHGLGVSVKHPLADVATAEWRAKVKQGGRR